LARCPNCGYEPPKGRKVVVRIFMSRALEKEWLDFSKDHNTKGDAFYDLLRKVKLYDKLQLERSRIAVEPPSTKT